MNSHRRYGVGFVLDCVLSDNFFKDSCHNEFYST